MESIMGSSDLLRHRDQIRAGMSALKGKKIVIVGDVGIDEYVNGEVCRISPEAPVPVLDVKEEQSRIGLAANVAQNISSLGGQPFLVGLVGKDEGAKRLGGLLNEAGVSPEHLISDGQRSTTRKLRVMSGHHHLVRVDYEQRQYLSDDIERSVLERVSSLLEESDGLLIEDYAKGVLSESLTQALIARAKKMGQRVIVDPHISTPLSYYRGADICTPNRDEAYQTSGLDLDELRQDEGSLKRVGESLRKKIGCKELIITRGKAGLSIFGPSGLNHLPTFARQVFDVTGAGDTVIAAIGIALAAGMSLETSCVFANYAAGVVVAKVGCVPCQLDELIESMDRHDLPDSAGGAN